VKQRRLAGIEGWQALGSKSIIIGPVNWVSGSIFNAAEK